MQPIAAFRLMFRIILRGAPLVPLVGGCRAPEDPALVRTGAGFVQGVSDSSGVIAFRGIPYAAPPVDSLRWKAPLPPMPWTDTLRATSQRASCLQPPSIRRFNQSVTAQLGGDTSAVPSLGETAEDCLYLNVWTPSLAEPAPVFLWIHGGGGTSGSASEPVFDGARLAAKGIVVITVNYRLGPFGFLAHPALSAETQDGVSGNYGLLDLVAALRWVRENVAAFGGDPDRVTMAGQSAGGTLAAHLMVMPAASGLYHRVILQSATGFDMAPPLRGEQSAESLGRDLGHALQLPADVTAAQLRAVPADVLLRTAFMNRLVPDGPVVDSVHLPVRPSEAVGTSGMAAVPMMLGSNARELGSLPFLLPPPATTRSAWIDAIRPVHAERSTALVDFYTGLHEDDLAAAQEAMTTDEFFRAPIFLVARKAADANVPVFVYQFSAVPAAVRAAGLGAFHGAELPYVFGNDMPSWWTFSLADRAVSDLVMDYWVSFVSTGDPNSPARPAWPRFSSSAAAFLDIDSTTAPRNFDVPPLETLLRAQATTP